ncbi:MAG: DUF2225 domain-containing protein [Defluviitaleaceae bacterium]|nr:DUF2225 domain-containing protein [Defluviitaleaceae bacterium]MCL2262211.1 DUF2225 domain-containing protein [Defluviitaleaceae bacterium]
MDVNALKNSESARRFTGGTVIAVENQKANDEMYIILEGQVEKYKNYQQAGETKTKTLGLGGIFGETSLFLQKAPSETWIAATDVVAYGVSRASALSFFQTQPQLTALLVKKLCEELDEARNAVAAPAPVAPSMPSAPISDTPPAGMISDTPPAGMISDTPPAGMISDTPPEGLIGDTPPGGGAPAEMPGELFPPDHQIYELQTEPASSDVIYKKHFKCPICEHGFTGWAIRTTRLKLEERDKDFRSHYPNIDTTYYEIVTCPECWYSNFEQAYSQPVISRFKENKDQISKYKFQIGLDLTEDRGINAVFAGFYLALKCAEVYYKNYEMNIAKMWLRLKWLYADVEDKAMEFMCAEKAHASYLAAFEKTDASPEALQQLCTLMGELSLIVKDVPNAKIFFVKARSYKNGSKALLLQAEDGIDTIRKIEAGVIRL